ncbi:glycoside hydrolase family 95 protein ['Paenibacillus yunnanensis' Narsing Rao et al. 2020]|uniref:glycoside hydrolase family 95 protein n=1 Tax=Paenibacillus tengchongensis TaxID=2608684 RepID=UPI00124E2439|nr:glycoside hydrolase family 95 protein [Paenibacillus tengchongensis]
MSGENVSYSWKLKYSQPAVEWEEALPLGNGHMGAMVFGGTVRERLQLNEDTLWSGFPRDTNNYEALRYLKRVRAMLAEGRYAEAEEVVNAKMLGVNCQAYMPLGDLYIGHLAAADADTYERELDLDSGIARVAYRTGAGAFTREAFVSAPDDVTVVRLTGEAKGGLQAELSLRSDLKASAEYDGEYLVLQGVAPTHIADNYHQDHPGAILYEDGLGMRFELHLQVVAQGGSVEYADGKLVISGADEALLLLASATNYKEMKQRAGHLAVTEEGGTADLTADCRRRLAAAAARSYDELRGRHVADHQALFRRVELDLGGQEKAELPTDQRLAAYQSGGKDPQLEALLFQYGRYLLIASSRPGTQAANLQGIWNQHVTPPWNSNYTTNINTQMNYWLAEVGNLHECHEPLMDFIREASETGARTARVHYGARGWVAHHNVDLWRSTVPSGGDASWAFWPLGGVWLSRHLWEHYLYEPDRTYLEERAYPLMKGAALFALDWLVEREDGLLVTSPSTSPENRFLDADGKPCSVSKGTAMDMTLIRELFGHCIEAARLLDADAEFRRLLEETLPRLTPLQIGEDGRLLEWSEPFAEAEPGHRHVSHLYGLYPGKIINERDTPELVEAGRRTLEHRISSGGGHTGWSCAWLINFYARLQDGETAHSFVRTLLTRSIYPNLFDAHPPFQIDGNFGAAAGIAEMLLQSHLDEISLLPALPADWQNGKVTGLKARGGLTVDIEWREHALVSARIAAGHDCEYRLRYVRGLKVQLPDGSGLAAEQPISFKAGEVYSITVSL